MLLATPFPLATISLLLCQKNIWPFRRSIILSSENFADRTSRGQVLCAVIGFAICLLKNGASATRYMGFLNGYEYTIFLGPISGSKLLCLWQSQDSSLIHCNNSHLRLLPNQEIRGIQYPPALQAVWPLLVPIRHQRASRGIIPCRRDPTATKPCISDQPWGQRALSKLHRFCIPRMARRARILGVSHSLL